MKTVVVGLALAMLSGAAFAQSYPDHPVKVVVPYPAGGGTDTVARAISQRLAEKWNQPVVVENRPAPVLPSEPILWQRPRRMATRCCSPTALRSSSIRTSTISFRSIRSRILNRSRWPFDWRLFWRRRPMLREKQLPELVALRQGEPGPTDLRDARHRLLSRMWPWNI